MEVGKCGRSRREERKAVASGSAYGVHRVVRGGSREGLRFRRFSYAPRNSLSAFEGVLEVVLTEGGGFEMEPGAPCLSDGPIYHPPPLSNIGVSINKEYPTKLSLLKDVLRPEVHEFQVLVEFDSTFVANTIGAFVGRNFSREKVKRGEIGLKRKLRYYMPLDEEEDLVVVLKSSDGVKFKYIIGNGIHFFFGKLSNGYYKVAISVYANEREGVTRCIVHSKGHYYDYDRDRPETVFFRLFDYLRGFFSHFETHRGLRIDLSRAKLSPFWIEQKIRYVETKELNIVRLIRNLGLKYPNHRSPPKSIRIEEHPSQPGTFYLCGAIIVHPFWEDMEVYLKSYRKKGYKTPALELEDHPAIEVKIHFKEQRDLLRDKEFQEFVREDCEKARCFLNEVALMGLDLERDLLPLHEGDDLPYGKLYEKHKELVKVLNYVAANPPVRKEEVIKHFEGEIKKKKVVQYLNILLQIGLIKKEGFKVKEKKGTIAFYTANIPSYSSEIAMLLKMHNADDVDDADVKKEISEGKKLLMEITSSELTLDVLEEIIKREAVTVPLLQRVLKAGREKIRYVLDKLASTGILMRYKGEKREIYYRFASEDMKTKVLRVFQAIGYKAKELFDPMLTTRFLEELKSAGDMLKRLIMGLFRKYGELMPIKLEVVLRGLQSHKFPFDKVKELLGRKIMEEVRKKGYISFRECLEVARGKMPDISGEKVEEVMKEVQASFNIISDVKLCRTITEKAGLCLIAYERDESGMFCVPQRLAWLKPEVIRFT